MVLNLNQVRVHVGEERQWEAINRIRTTKDEWEIRIAAS